MYIGPHVKKLYSCPILMKLEFSQQIFKKCSNIKFLENPSSGSLFVPCRQTDRQTDMTKLIVACYNFANAPINIRLLPYTPHLATITLITTFKINRLLREKISPTFHKIYNMNDIYKHTPKLVLNIN